MIGTYYRLSLADEDVGADKAESNSIQGQRGLVKGTSWHAPNWLQSRVRSTWTMAIPAPLQAALRSSS